MNKLNLAFLILLALSGCVGGENSPTGPEPTKPTGTRCEVTAGDWEGIHCKTYPDSTAVVGAR